MTRMTPKQRNAVSYILRELASRDYLTPDEERKLIAACDSEYLTIEDARHIVGDLMELQRDTRENVTEDMKLPFLHDLKSIITRYNRKCAEPGCGNVGYYPGSFCPDCYRRKGEGYRSFSVLKEGYGTK